MKIIKSLFVLKEISVRLSAFDLRIKGVYCYLLLLLIFFQGIVANTVGPFNNPTETYPFYSLPFCSGTGRQRRHKQDLGETLSGSR